MVAQILNSKLFLSNNLFFRLLRKITYFLLGCKISGKYRSNSLLRKCRFSCKNANLAIGKSGYINNALIQCSGNGNSIIIGNKARINQGLTIEIRGNNNLLIIGDDCSFGNASSVKILGDSCVVHIGNKAVLGLVNFDCRDNGSRVEIGDEVDFNQRVNIVSMEGKSISIGNKTLIAYDVEIRNTDSHSLLDCDGNRINYGKDVYVGNEAWIGQGALILKGSYLADGSIVGAKSIITKQFRDCNCVVSGNPAVVRNNNVMWKKERL